MAESADGRSRMVIGRLTRAGFERESSAAVEASAAEFVRTNAVQWNAFVEPLLLDRWHRAVMSASFCPRINREWSGTEGNPPNELILDAPAVRAALLCAINDPAFFRVVELVAGCEPIGC